MLSVDPLGGVFELVDQQLGHERLWIARDGRTLADAVTRCTLVVVDQAAGKLGGADACVLIGPRQRGQGDTEWLSEAVGRLIDVLPCTSNLSPLVEETLSRMLHTRVSLGRRREAGESQPRMRQPSDDPEGLRGLRRRQVVDISQRWREIHLAEVGPDHWLMMMPKNAPIEDLEIARATTLAQHFTKHLLAPSSPIQQPAVEPSDRHVVPPTGRPVTPPPDWLSGLLGRALEGDVPGFTQLAGSWLGGVVDVLGRDGQPLLESAIDNDVVAGCGRVQRGETKDILLVDDAGIWGALRIPAGVNTPSREVQAAALALALVQSVALRRERMLMENRIALLTCLGDETLAFTSHIQGGESKRRLVVIATPVKLSSNDITRLTDRISRAAAQDPVLRGLLLVPANGGLLGVYPDHGTCPSVHHQSWSRVRTPLSTPSGPTILIGSPCSRAVEFREEHRKLTQLSRIAHCSHRFFDLEPVSLLERLGPVTEVLHAMPGHQVIPFVDRVLGDLLADDRFGGQVIDTLFAYLQTRGNLRETGEFLHLHVSTVKYRMRVIRDLLGARLDDQTSRFDLELAVRLCLAARALKADTSS